MVVMKVRPLCSPRGRLESFLLQSYDACVVTGGLQKRTATSSVPAQPGVGNSPTQQDKIQLQREVGLFSAVNLIIGVMIGNWTAGLPVSVSVTK
jgi:hypothetical protein